MTRGDNASVKQLVLPLGQPRGEIAAGESEVAAPVNGLKVAPSQTALLSLETGGAARLPGTA